MSNNPPPAPDPATTSKRPDPLFKFLTRLEAEEHGLIASETEFQYSTRADLVLSVPPGLSLEGTLFDFFRAVNVIEFKSQNDPFNLREYIRNELRTDLQLLQSNDENFDNILNVIVSSREPQRFFSLAAKKGVSFKPDEAKPWLWRNQNGFQNIAIVVCRDLPIEKPYYLWLTFAPTDSLKWDAFVGEMIKQQNQPVLEVLQSLKPKEFAMVEEKYKELIIEALKRPEFNEPIEEPLELRAELLLEAVAHDYPQVLDKVLSVLKPEERLAGLDPQERLAGLDPEERQKLLKLLLEQSKEEQA